MEAKETNKVPYNEPFTKTVDEKRILIDFKKIPPPSYIFRFFKPRVVKNNFYELHRKNACAPQALVKSALSKVFQLSILKTIEHISKISKSISNQTQSFMVQKQVIQALVYTQEGACPALLKLKAYTL